MKRVPKVIHDHIINARLYLEAVQKFPSPTNYAVQILLLLVSWENIVIADQELHRWARKSPGNIKLLRDHEEKFKGAHSISRTIIGPPGTPAKEEKYETPNELKKLRSICQYGLSSGSRDIKKMFERYWHTEGFERDLANKIKWVELFVGIHEDILNGKKSLGLGNIGKVRVK